MQIADALGDDSGLRGIYKEQHQGTGKHPHPCGDDNAENQGGGHGPFQARLDALPLSGPVVLGNEGGEGVSEILDGHVGEGVDFHGGGESGHDRWAEAVDQSLDHENPQIHHRLLDAGEDGKASDFLKRLELKLHMTLLNPQAGEAQPVIGGQPHSRYILGNDGGLRRPGHTTV